MCYGSTDWLTRWKHWESESERVSDPIESTELLLACIQRKVEKRWNMTNDNTQSGNVGNSANRANKTHHIQLRTRMPRWWINYTCFAKTTHRKNCIKLFIFKLFIVWDILYLPACAVSFCSYYIQYLSIQWIYMCYCYCTNTIAQLAHVGIPKGYTIFNTSMW